ncbi:MAG TPA: hypothetical protein VMS96_03565 [Terriglobales bacterium]|nr:hypothetical protein [Terriglobales bacterium]
MLEDLREAFSRPWRPVPRWALIAWTACYGLFLVYALRNREGFLFVDNVNLVVHESGHALFGWFGQTLGLWGGTIMQLLVPLLLAASFAYRRQTAAAAFCLFVFFENFLYVATYMADARIQQLDLVSLGGGDGPVEHDWYLMLSQLGLLQQDRSIAAVVRTLGFLGMAASVGWLWLRGGAAEKTHAAGA